MHFKSTSLFIFPFYFMGQFLQNYLATASLLKGRFFPATTAKNHQAHQFYPTKGLLILNETCAYEIGLLGAESNG
jgi:hypothetical protein